MFRQVEEAIAARGQHRWRPRTATPPDALSGGAGCRPRTALKGMPLKTQVLDGLQRRNADVAAPLRPGRMHIPGRGCALQAEGIDVAERGHGLHLLHLGMCAMVLILLASVQPVFAQSHGGGGHGGGHGGGGHGGRWHGGGSEWWGLGLGLGLGWGIAGLIEPYPYGYYPYPAYEYPYRGYEQPYAVAPPLAAMAPPAPQYAPGSAPAAGSWYYCDSARGYYPYVTQCPEAWRAVPAVPAGPVR